MNSPLTFFALVTALLIPSIGRSEEWPRFRGENGSGVSSDQEVALEWSAEKNMAWSRDLPGMGSSSPIAWGDRVFVTCYSGYGIPDGSNSIADLKRHVVALNRETGEIVWTANVAGAGGSEDPFVGFLGEHGYASNTPVTDGKSVFCFFGKAGVVAFDFDGKELWRKPVGTMHSQKRWGSASSPILVGDMLIVKAGDESRAVYGFDKRTGEEKWKAEGSVLEQTYGTPVVHRVDDSRTDLIVAGTGEVWGMNPETGGLRWFSEMGLKGNISSSSVVEGDQLILFGGFPRTMGLGMKLGLKGDVSGKATLWENTKVKAYMTTPIFHNGHLYFIRDEGIACCADPVKGELIYEERLPEASGTRGKGKPFYASPVIVNGHLLAVSRTAGTFVIEAKPAFNLVRKNVIEGDETRFQGTPAISDGQIFLRSEKTLYCIAKSSE
ncbi:MAG: outer membrane protein assembly factor BamB family protein [Verrucomicrobiales bacterium]